MTAPQIAQRLKIARSTVFVERQMYANHGMFALFINRKFKIRWMAVLPEGEVRVFDCRKRPRRRTYSREEFRRTVTVVGRVVISGHYPDINPE